MRLGNPLRPVPAYLPGYFNAFRGYRLDRHMLLQFINQGTTAVTSFEGIGAGDAMSEFRHRDGGNGNFDFAIGLKNTPKKFFDRLILALRVEMTLESRTIPRMASSMDAGELRYRLPRPCQSLRPKSLWSR